MPDPQSAPPLSKAKVKKPLDPPLTIHVFVPPKSQAKVLRLTAPFSKQTLKSRKPTSWEGANLRSDWEWGPQDVEIDHDFKWLFPVRSDKPVSCAQGFDGCYTHTGDLRYSIDFNIPVGTEILAPRDGLVVDLKQDSDLVGVSPDFEKHANYVSVVHEDGTCSELIHLDHNGVKVELGDIVKRGDYLGLSGNTGYSFGPHLHFHVRESADQSGKTIPISFDNKTSEGFMLCPGQAYNPKTNEIVQVPPPKIDDDFVASRYPDSAPMNTKRGARLRRR